MVSKHEFVQVFSSATIGHSGPPTNPGYPTDRALNDPFELRPVVRGLKDIASTTQLLSDQYDRADLPEEFQRFAHQLNLAVPELKDGLKANVVAGAVGIFNQFSPSMVELVLESLGTKLGILSLSETRSSPVMWAHYAADHSGFLIVFDERSPWFWAKKGDLDEFRHIRKVTYLEMSRPGYPADVGAQELFYSKLSEWKYEREWRIIRPLAESSSRLGDIYLFDVPADSIKGVVLGFRANDALATALRSAVRDNPSLRHISVGQAVLSKNSNSIEINPAS